MDYYLLLHPPIPFLYHYIRKTIWCSPRSKVYAFKFLWINYHSAEFEPIFKLLKTFSKLHFHFMVLLKSDSHLPKKCVLFAWLKALFGHVRKNGLIRKIRLTSKFMTSQTGLQAIAIHILPNISQSKGNWTMIFSQLIEYNKRNIFLQKLCRKPLYFLKKLNMRWKQVLSSLVFDIFR